MKRSLARVDEPCMSPALKRAKVQAQRKFAQGSSNYSYSSSPPIPSKHRDCYGFFPYQNGQLTDGSENDDYEMNSFSSLPTIDDFLTFLCFRETDALPKKLDYLNTPQLNGHVKKKQSKLSNAVHHKNISNDRKNAPPSKINAKPNCSIAKKKLPQYTLRSRNLSCKSIATKSSHSLALKHNQRLRSKSVAEAKFIENQFQNMKNRNVITNNLSPLTSRICSNSKVKQVSRNHFKNRPLTRALRKRTLSTFSSEDEDLKRITRRNLTPHKQKLDAENNENLPQRDKSPKRKISTGVETRKMTTKLLQVSIPKFKPNATLVDQGISRTVTRNSSKNSDSASRDALSSFSISPAPTVNARPSRRTKEAAALYMEMLGKELLCPDESCDDDDNISVDSFPELPNAVEHIRREKELKEQHQKKMVEQTRRNSVPKDKGVASTSTEAEPSSADASNEKIAAIVDAKKEAKKTTHDGLCTRSKQYDVDAAATSTRREQSVKIIRTRVKNDRFAGLNRRNSYNDIFNRSKGANEDFKESDTAKGSKKANEPATTAKKFVNDRPQCVNEKPKDKICKSNENVAKTIADVLKICKNESLPEEKLKNVEPKTAETSMLSVVVREKANVCETTADSCKKNKPKKEHTVGAPVIIERISTKKNIDSKSTKHDKVKSDSLKYVKQGVKSKTPVGGKGETLATAKDTSSEPQAKVGKNRTNNESDETMAPNTVKASKCVDVGAAGANDRATTKPTESTHDCRAKDGKAAAAVVLNDEARRTSVADAKSSVSEAKSGSAGVDCGPAGDEPKQKSTKAVDDGDGETKTGDVASSCGKTGSKSKTLDAPATKMPSTVGKVTAAASAADKSSSERKKIIFKKNAAASVTRKKDETAGRKSDAFSPDNENSVYAFEPDLPTTSPPFRHLKPITPPKSVAGSSIAVQVNFKNGAKLECSNSVETRVSSTSDGGDRVFYIPIQTSDSTSTLGVALKLDTDGANQKIIMSATLITNSTTLTTSTCTSITATTSSKKTQADVKLLSSLDDGVTKSTSSGVASKMAVSTSGAAHSAAVAAPTSGGDGGAASTTTKAAVGGRKTSSPSKANQSVKIVKLNKNKKGKVKLPETAKAKSQSPKNKVKKKLFADSSDKPTTKTKGEILDAPTFNPSAEEFNDPLEYIEKIRAVAEKYGLCRIVPPASFKPECKVTDEMRFTAYNQYVHKMLHRWGPNVKELMAIKKFLLTQNITLNQAPLIGGMEVDLPLLYQVVQQCGGLNAVIEKERWHQVADIMKIPKLAQDRITKLDDIYCKYLLPYDVLSHDERENLLKEIDKEWASHLQKPIEDDVFEDVDECIIKGRTMPLSCFYRIARNTMLMRYGSVDGQEGGQLWAKIEGEFWTHVSERKSHVCVHSGSIDSGSQGYGFSVDKKSTFKKHPWNLKVLTNNQASVLRSLGPVMGVTVPTLHVSMLYSACCWYRDPHGLPWIEYLHTGADKIWYGIPDEQNERFKEAMSSVVPRYCRDTKIWLPSDTAMIPPPLLTEHGVSLSRVVQHPGQFIVVFPKSFTSSISTGYLVSESVYFAQASWLNSAKRIFEDMQDSCEPSIFSLEHLLICIAEDTRTRVSTLDKVLPLLIDLRDTEMALRQQLKELGVDAMEKMVASKKRKSKGAFSDEDNNECESCRTILFVSQVHVTNSNDLSYYCLRHAVSFLLKKPAQAKHCQLSYLYSEEELGKLIDKVAARIGAKNKKKT